jgi:hypothetical protein
MTLELELLLLDGGTTYEERTVVFDFQFPKFSPSPKRSRTLTLWPDRTPKELKSMLALDAPGDSHEQPAPGLNHLLSPIFASA